MQPQNSDLSPIVWGELGNQEFLQGMYDPVGAPCWSSVTPLPLDRGRKDHQHLCLWHKSTQGRTAGVLPIPKTFPPCPSGVCMPWTLGPAALGELWSVLCPRGGTSCSWLSPAWPSEPAVCSHRALGTCPLLNQCLTSAAGVQGGKSCGVQQRKFPNQRALWQ